MPYLSLIIDAKVTDSADNVVGRLNDVVVIPKPGEYAPLQYLAIKSKSHKKVVYIPFEYVENFSHEDVSLKKRFSKIPFRENVPQRSIFLEQDVMDQQIVDMEGARVVRVNDLKIGDFEGRTCILGIDVSTKGLLRRLGIEWMDFFDFFKVHLIDWRKAQTVHRAIKLDTVSQHLTKLHPADLADVIEDMSIKHSGKLMKVLDAKSAAKVLEEVEPNLQKILVKYMGPDQAGEIVAKMPIEEIVDLMKTLKKGEATRFLKHMRDGNIKQMVEKMLIYHDDTAGGLMTVDYVTVRPNWTVSKAVEEIKKATTKNVVLYIYVTGEDGYFHGVVSLRWIICSSPNTKMKEILKTFPSHTALHVNQEIEEVIEVMTRYNLFTAAVLDDKHHLVGVVTIDDVMRHLFPNA